MERRFDNGVSPFLFPCGIHAQRRAQQCITFSQVSVGGCTAALGPAAAHEAYCWAKACWRTEGQQVQASMARVLLLWGALCLRCFLFSCYEVAILPPPFLCCHGRNPCSTLSLLLITSAKYFVCAYWVLMRHSDQCSGKPRVLSVVAALNAWYFVCWH